MYKQKSGPPGTRRALVSLAERIRPRARGFTARADERAVSSYSPEGALTYMRTRSTRFKPAEDPTRQLPQSAPKPPSTAARKHETVSPSLFRSISPGFVALSAATLNLVPNQRLVPFFAGYPALEIGAKQLMH